MVYWQYVLCFAYTISIIHTSVFEELTVTFENEMMNNAATGVASSYSYYISVNTKKSSSYCLFRV